MVTFDQEGVGTKSNSVNSTLPWEPLGRVLDSLVSCDLTARGICDRLYDGAVQWAGGPLTTTTALSLQERVRLGDPVFICTGWPSRSWLIKGLTETDGPVGAAYLARTLEQALGAVPVLVVEESLVRFAETALRAAGLLVADIGTALRSKQGPHRASVAAVLPFTTDWDRSAGEARALLTRYSPAAIIAIEMPGANADGVFHNVTGRVVPSELVAKADALVSEARAVGILTIGIGDGGNELGMGSIADVVARCLPDGEKNAPVGIVDHLVVGSVSNFAALGLSAAVAAISGQPEILRTVDLLRITEKLSDAGAIDGLTAYLDPKNDGASAATSAALVEIVATAVEMRLRGWIKG